ncbi:MAG TPA: DinB family protein [Tepidisphaeraceae bacterium]|nr:DinB family protein [Tepidisphaeraceae bacterium]
MPMMDALTDVLAGNMEMLKATVADLSEQEMLIRPVPGANHAAWQLGHLACSERSMVHAINPGAAADLPAGFVEKFSKETAKSDDPKAFASKEEILNALMKMRAATIAWAKTLTPADLEKPGPERMRRMAATVGHMVAFIPSHAAMHVGQIQVLRRKLGRPVMF